MADPLLQHRSSGPGRPELGTLACVPGLLSLARGRGHVFAVDVGRLRIRQ